MVVGWNVQSIVENNIMQITVNVVWLNLGISPSKNYISLAPMGKLNNMILYVKTWVKLNKFRLLIYNMACSSQIQIEVN